MKIQTPKYEEYLTPLEFIEKMFQAKTIKEINKVSNKYGVK